MTKKAIVCCGERDQEMLAAFIKRWRELYPDVELWLGNDTYKPVTIPCDLPQVHLSWDKQIGKHIVNAMLETGGDIVAKVDVDSWHLRNDLFDPFKYEWVMASGHQWANEPGRFLGIAYALRRETLLSITVGASCRTLNGKDDDKAISHAVRIAYPNGIFLQPYMQCRRADTWNGEDVAIIHCGLYGHSDEGRKKAYDELVRISKGEHVTSKESAWVGMSVMPSRLHGVSSIVDTLQSGPFKPKGIVLSIPKKAGRVNESYDENEIANLTKKAIVHRCGDLGPITKLVGLCEKVTSDDLCIILDDDRHYSPHLVARMAAEYKEGHAIANSVLHLSNTQIPEGFGAIIFRRSLIDLRKLKNLISFLNEHFTESLLADDAIIGWFLQSEGVTVVGMQKSVHNHAMPSTYDDCALRAIDGGHAERYRRVLQFLNENRAAITKSMQEKS